MPASATIRRHLSDDGVWRACRARTKPCGYERHRLEEAGSASRSESLPSPTQLLGADQNDYYYLDTELKLAPAGSTGKYCPACSTYISIATLAAHMVDQYACPACGKEAFVSDMPTDLRADQVRFLSDSEVKASRWFHISQSPNWDAGTKEDEVVTHLGSKEAAMERMGHLIGQRKDPEKPFYLHEVRLHETAEVKPGIWHDQMHWPEMVGQFWTEEDGKIGVGEQQVQRYMNFYEGPGTVSLLADPNSYALIASVEIPSGS